MLLHDEKSAEDAVHETFVTAMINVEKLMRIPNPCGWLVNTLKNKNTLQPLNSSDRNGKHAML